MNQNLLKLIDTGQASYDAWEHGLKQVREGAEKRLEIDQFIAQFDKWSVNDLPIVRFGNRNFKRK